MPAAYEPSANDGVSAIYPNEPLAVLMAFIAPGLRPYLARNGTCRHSALDNVIKIGRGALSAASHGVGATRQIGTAQIRPAWRRSGRR
jgi:hypothetical protein